jgi:hypothetical protein
MHLCFQILKLQYVAFSVKRKVSFENAKCCSKTAKHQLSRIKSLVNHRHQSAKVYFYEGHILVIMNVGTLEYYGSLILPYYFLKFVFWQLWPVGCAGCTDFGCLFLADKLGKKFGQQFF